MISYADAFTGQYRDERQLCEAVLGRLKIEGRERGWRGFHLVDAAWTACTPPILAITLGPGHSDPGPDDVRAICRKVAA